MDHFSIVQGRLLNGGFEGGSGFGCLPLVNDLLMASATMGVASMIMDVNVVIIAYCYFTKAPGFK